MERERDARAEDGQIALFTAMSLHSLEFGDRELIETLLCRVSDYFADALGVGEMDDLYKSLARSFASVCGSTEAARERLLRAARACIDSPEESGDEAKFLTEVVSFLPELPSSPPDPAPAVAAAGQEPAMQRFTFNLLACEPRVLEPDDASAFLDDLREWLELCELAQKQEVEVGWLQ